MTKSWLYNSLSRIRRKVEAIDITEEVARRTPSPESRIGEEGQSDGGDRKESHAGGLKILQESYSPCYQCFEHHYNTWI